MFLFFFNIDKKIFRKSSIWCPTIYEKDILNTTTKYEALGRVTWVDQNCVHGFVLHFWVPVLSKIFIGFIGKLSVNLWKIIVLSVKKFPIKIEGLKVHDQSELCCWSALYCCTFSVGHLTIKHISCGNEDNNYRVDIFPLQLHSTLPIWLLLQKVVVNWLNFNRHNFHWPNFRLTELFSLLPFRLRILRDWIYIAPCSIRQMPKCPFCNHRWARSWAVGGG